MTPLDALSPDQRAVLQLLLKQGKNYEELATLLRIDPAAVRARAVAALDALGPETELVPGRRAELADWLLGQQDPEATARTVEYVEAAPAAQAWAATIEAALREGGLGAGRLPEVPTTPLDEDPEPVALPPAPAPTPTPAAPQSAGAERLPGFTPADGDDGVRQPASKLGGALLLAGIVIVLAVALVWALSRDDDGDPAAVAQTATATETAPTTTEPVGEPTIVGQANLTAPDGGEALGVANIVAQGQERAIALRAEKLQPNTRRDAYGVWLTGDDGRVERLFFAPAVASNGRMEGGSLLPADLERYDRVVVSLETGDVRRPTNTVLSGRLRVRG
ncbi:MAG TPA: hypothetical protein VIL49_14535 [Capillimicrobium sp.]